MFKLKLMLLVGTREKLVDETRSRSSVRNEMFFFAESSYQNFQKIGLALLSELDSV